MNPCYSSYTDVLLSLLMIMFMASPRSIDATENPAAILIRVDPSGKGDYRKLQDAIDAVPSNNKEVVFILVKPGIYKEKIVVPADRPFITISGSKANGTIITWDDSGNIFESPTFSVLASDFVARYLTIQNTHGAGAKAVALRVSGGRVAFFGCRFLSYQGTLLDDTGRHYYSGCFIEGPVDFICGNAASLFEMPLAFTLGRRCSYHPPTQGVTFRGHRLYFLGLQGHWRQDCSTGKGMGSIFQGRFRPYLYVQCDSAPRWDDWGDSSKQSWVFYREYKFYGPGANTKKRVEWSQELTGIKAQPFLTKNMIGRKSWIRSTPTRFKKASTAVSNNSTRHA